MSGICRICGSTKSQAISDARAVGLEQELQGGIYTCCQIAEWADEQWFAWFEAIQEDGKRVDDVTRRAELSETEAVLVSVWLRRSQVPWYRSPDDLS
jgi:hypothetical protein